MLKGVKSVLPGYAGGVGVPTYESVSGGETGHADVVKIEFDESEVSLENLLTVFFASHDPTTLNRQGNDIGTQYRSVVFYTDIGQKAVIENFITKINESVSQGRPIVTQVEPLDRFFPAESYHLEYFENHRDAPYCELVINPKLEKVQQEFSSLIKNKNV